MRYVQVSISLDHGNMCVMKPEEALEMAKMELEECSPGDWIKLERIEMTEEAVKKLPEFKGW